MLDDADKMIYTHLDLSISLRVWVLSAWESQRDDPICRVPSTGPRHFNFVTETNMQLQFSLIADMGPVRLGISMRWSLLYDAVQQSYALLPSFLLQTLSGCGASAERVLKASVGSHNLLTISIIIEFSSATFSSISWPVRPCLFHASVALMWRITLINFWMVHFQCLQQHCV